MTKEAPRERLDPQPSMEALTRRWLQLDVTGKKAPEKIAGFEAVISDLAKRETSGLELTVDERTSLHDARSNLGRWRSIIEENDTKLAAVSVAIAARSDEFDTLLLESEAQLRAREAKGEGETDEEIAPYQQHYEDLLEIQRRIFEVGSEDETGDNVIDSSLDAERVLPSEEEEIVEPSAVFGPLNSVDVEVLRRVLMTHDDFLARLIAPDKDPAETKKGSVFAFSQEPLQEGEVSIGDPTERRKEALNRVREMAESENILRVSEDDLEDPVIKNAFLLVGSFFTLAQQCHGLQREQSGMDTLIGILTDPEVRRRGFIVESDGRRFSIYEADTVGQLKRKAVFVKEIHPESFPDEEETRPPVAGLPEPAIVGEPTNVDTPVDALEYKFDLKLEDLVKPGILLPPNLRAVLLVLKELHNSNPMTAEELSSLVNLSPRDVGDLLRSLGDVLAEGWVVSSYIGKKGGYVLDQVRKVDGRIEYIYPGLEDFVKTDKPIHPKHRTVLRILKEQQGGPRLNAEELSRQVDFSSKSIKDFLSSANEILVKGWAIVEGANVGEGFSLDQMVEIDGKMKYVYPGLEGVVESDEPVHPNLQLILRILLKQYNGPRLNAEELSRQANLSSQEVRELLAHPEEVLFSKWKVTYQSGESGGFVLRKEQPGEEIEYIDPQLKGLVRAGIPVDSRLQDLLVVLKGRTRSTLSEFALGSLVDLPSDIVLDLLSNADEILAEGWKIVSYQDKQAGFFLEQVREIDGKIEYIYPDLEGIVKPEVPIHPNLQSILHILKDNRIGPRITVEELRNQLHLSTNMIIHFLSSAEAVLTEEWRIVSEGVVGGGHSLDQMEKIDGKMKYVYPGLEGVVESDEPVSPNLQAILRLLKDNLGRRLTAEEIGEQVGLSSRGVRMLLSKVRKGILAPEWQVTSKRGGNPSIDNPQGFALELGTQYQEIVNILRDNRERELPDGTIQTVKLLNAKELSEQVGLPEKAVKNFLSNTGIVLSEGYVVASYSRKSKSYALEKVRKVDGKIEYIYPGLEGMVNPEIPIDPNFRALLRILKENQGKRGMTAEALSKQLDYSTEAVRKFLKTAKSVLTPDWKIIALTTKGYFLQPMEQSHASRPPEVVLQEDVETKIITPENI